MSDFVTARAVWSNGQVRVLEEFELLVGLRSMKLGAGEELVVRIERPEPAYTFGQMKHYRGYVVRPLSAWNGDSHRAWHDRLKREFMPYERTSLKQLNAVEFGDFVMACEIYAHTEHPEAFESTDTV